MHQAVPYNFKELTSINNQKSNSNIDILKNVEAKLDLSIGNSTLTFEDILKLKDGSLLKVEGNTAKIEIDISIQGKSIGKGEVVLIDDEPYVRITKLNKK